MSFEAALASAGDHLARAIVVPAARERLVVSIRRHWEKTFATALAASFDTHARDTFELAFARALEAEHPLAPVMQAYIIAVALALTPAFVRTLARGVDVDAAALDETAAVARTNLAQVCGRHGAYAFDLPCTVFSTYAFGNRHVPRTGRPKRKRT